MYSDLNEEKSCWNLKGEAIDHTIRGTRFGRGKRERKCKNDVEGKA